MSLNVWDYFLRGLILGFSIAAPVGPIGVLCIKRTIAGGRLSGFMSGLGAATADALYGSLAAFGMIAITNLFIEQQKWLSLLGGIFLIYLGLRTLLLKPATVKDDEVNVGGLVVDFASTFMLTLTNPLTILSFAAIFTGIGLGEAANQPNIGGMIVLGVFAGSATWWLLLSNLVGILRDRFQPLHLIWVNRVSAMIIICFGVIALWRMGELNEGEIVSALITDSQFLQQRGSEGFSVATPGTSLKFPTDFGAHPDFQTEWWYYTGNLEDQSGERFGYQLTFFRRALLPPDMHVDRDSTWATEQVYLAHFAVTNVNENWHVAFERISRGAAGMSGAKAEPFEVWLENWQVIQTAPIVYRLIAEDESEENIRVSLDLSLNLIKDPVLQGEDGYSQKGLNPGNASFYYSFTRLETTGTIKIDDKEVKVNGYSWMDHEFSTSALAPDQIGWDWFSIQLDDNSELMLFQIRKQDGTIDRYSSGKWIGPEGETLNLYNDNFSVEVLDDWLSPRSGGNYPASWNITIPELDLTLEISPLVQDQELKLTYTYWEGAVEVRGNYNGTQVTGYGYVELTGYAGSMGGEF
jgi:predicted secreted hydrolase/threonine/homoserine/homoserine lactone efflux protein